jgi:uncharacterized membrane protein YdbT with pleckstrin-like domain
MSSKYIKNLLATNELVLLETRQHSIVLIREILPEIGSAIAIALLTTLSWMVWLGNPLVAFAYLFLLLPIFSLIKDVLAWTNHQYIVTDRRVIQVFGIITKNVTDSSLDKVNDVKMVQTFWGRLLNFGSIEILTASELGINRFTSLDKPVQLKTAMLNAKEALKTTQTNKGPMERSGKNDPIYHLDALLKTGVINEERYNNILSTWKEK